MISARNLLISILGAILSAASLICAQDVKPPEPTVALQPPPVIQELALQPQRFLASSLRTDAFSSPLMDTPDLSRYQEFRFGTDLVTVTKQAEMQPSEATVIHQESSRNLGVTQLSLGLGTAGTIAETLLPVRYSGPWSGFAKAGAPRVASSAFVAA
jgi:hypothetical protein